MPEREFQLTIHDGRLMHQSVFWWVRSGLRPPSELYCYHNRPLDQSCHECEERE